MPRFVFTLLVVGSCVVATLVWLYLVYVIIAESNSGT